MNAAIYQSVTERIVETLAKGVVPWKKPWQHVPALPCNAVTQRPYRGVNVLLLCLAPYRDTRWLTFQQAKERGGNVLRGERSTEIVFWKPWTVEEVGEDGIARQRSIPLLKTFRVFNAEQCEGLGLPAQMGRATLAEYDRIAAAEYLATCMPDPPAVREGGSSAWYRPADDTVGLPPIGAFYSADSYYATRFHELGHATGHERRLCRPGVTGEILFGSSDYSHEELVAELTSAFCCALVGVDNSLLANSAAYIQSWLDVLKADAKLVVVAAAQAQKATDYIRGIAPQGLP